MQQRFAEVEEAVKVKEEMGEDGEKERLKVTELVRENEELREEVKNLHWRPKYDRSALNVYEDAVSLKIAIQNLHIYVRDIFLEDFSRNISRWRGGG